MIQRIFTALQLRHLVLGVLFVCFGLSTNAQVSTISTNSSTFQWKDRAVMEQIIQQELTETNASLALPNLTDWSTAMLEAYRSFLTTTQSSMNDEKDMMVVLDVALSQVKTEQVSNQASRNMVLDEMNAKQGELIQKLTYN